MGTCFPEFSKEVLVVDVRPEPCLSNRLRFEHVDCTICGLQVEHTHLRTLEEFVGFVVAVVNPYIYIFKFSYILCRKCFAVAHVDF